MDSSPSLFEIKSEIQHYDSIEKKIDDIDPIIFLESIELSTGKVVIICYRQQLDKFKLLFFTSLYTMFTLCATREWREIKYYSIQPEEEAKVLRVSPLGWEEGKCRGKWLCDPVLILS